LTVLVGAEGSDRAPETHAGLKCAVFAKIGHRDSKKTNIGGLPPIPCFKAAIDGVGFLRVKIGKVEGVKNWLELGVWKIHPGRKERASDGSALGGRRQELPLGGSQHPSGYLTREKTVPC
jgi:hypothetical protein